MGSPARAEGWVGTAAAIAVAAAVAAMALGCAAPQTTADPSVAANAATTSVPARPMPVEVDTAGDARSAFGQLVIDDGLPEPGYLRDLFPTWKDIDGDGCDARRQALIAASTTPAVTGARCAVISGTWTSAYDGTSSTVPTDMQIDHVVPLANAWRSGAYAWTTDQRTTYANDQPDLWVASARSNQSKGDRGPEQWRPPNRSIWCTYARRWVGIKTRWRLTVTTPERDALGQMLDTC
jgi:5-methylcytosine-specific restriction endonuclease McrA